MFDMSKRNYIVMQFVSIHNRPDAVYILDINKNLVAAYYFKSEVRAIAIFNRFTPSGEYYSPNRRFLSKESALKYIKEKLSTNPRNVFVEGNAKCLI